MMIFPQRTVFDSTQICEPGSNVTGEGSVNFLDKRPLAGVYYNFVLGASYVP